MTSDEFEKINVLKTHYLLKELELAKEQTKDCAGNAWIYKVLTDAGIKILLLENEIHDLENRIELLKDELEELGEQEND